MMRAVLKRRRTEWEKICRDAKCGDKKMKKCAGHSKAKIGEGVVLKSFLFAVCIRKLKALAFGLFGELGWRSATLLCLFTNRRSGRGRAKATEKHSPSAGLFVSGQAVLSVAAEHRAAVGTLGRGGQMLLNALLLFLGRDNLGLTVR